MVFVDGKILAGEVEITEMDEWMDIVFEESYNLRKLSEVGDYVAKHKHLPDIPSASEVKEKGIKLGEMNGLLLQKIEELTLYILQQQKEIDELKNIITD